MMDKEHRQAHALKDWQKIEGGLGFGSRNKKKRKEREKKSDGSRR